MMMRLFGKGLLVLAVMAWAGTASAASISAVGPAGVHLQSDLVTVEVSLDGSGLPGSGAVASMFFHVDFTSNLSLVSRTYATGLPGVFWGTLSGHGTVDANGLYTAQYDVTDTGGAFSDQLIVTMVFHVVEPGSGTAVVTPIFATGDAIGGGAADGFPNLTPYFTELNSATIITPEPTTAVLLGLGLLGIAYAGRRR